LTHLIVNIYIEFSGILPKFLFLAEGRGEW